MINSNKPPKTKKIPLRSAAFAESTFFVLSTKSDSIASHDYMSAQNE